MGLTPCADRISLAQVFSADAVFQSHQCGIKAWEKTGVLAALCLLADLRGSLVNLFVNFSPFFFLYKYPESFQCNLERPKRFSLQSVYSPSISQRKVQRTRKIANEKRRGSQRAAEEYFFYFLASRFFALTASTLVSNTRLHGIEF